MDTDKEILRSLGRIEGRLDAFDKLLDRVSKLEAWQYWLKGGWTALAAICVCLWKGTFGK